MRPSLIRDVRFEQIGGGSDARVLDDGVEHTLSSLGFGRLPKGSRLTGEVGM